jgi:hypothetical protein
MSIMVLMLIFCGAVLVHGAGRLRLHSGSIRHYPPPQQKSASNTE